eukprot:1626998-Pyramimonas_sp.AAC.1
MRDLQRIPSPLLRDHCPMLWRVHYRLRTAPHPDGRRPRWDRDLMGQALKLRGAPEFIAELERRCE